MSLGEQLNTVEGVVDWVKRVDLSPSGTGRTECAFVSDCVRWYLEFMEVSRDGCHYNLRELPERMSRVMSR